MQAALSVTKTHMFLTHFAADRWSLPPSQQSLESVPLSNPEPPRSPSHSDTSREENLQTTQRPNRELPTQSGNQQPIGFSVIPQSKHMLLQSGTVWMTYNVVSDIQENPNPAGVRRNIVNDLIHHPVIQ